MGERECDLEEGSEVLGTGTSAHSAINGTWDKQSTINHEARSVIYTESYNTAATMMNKTHPTTSKALDDAPCHAPQGKART
jgi:hypothetical protein